VGTLKNFPRLCCPGSGNFKRINDFEEGFFKFEFIYSRHHRILYRLILMKFKLE